ncbi:hypothetical protein Skr01_22540 [Sphaerisporangium krabiense]|uniref:Uncharacterized protein (DUF305 family) n=1 Tax=Sphaerisporangium krabiense TaxID=763782 RepID=A0A7W8Z675_9ACTN|nr:DUF305 domain-containing protein [Sphaerisporangium krabiense]MBB5628005.1 uncharacterized protein (DUF305 family) [Sphaerisporangium krabiense]GII62169.1 hypothetical protein Skr01_22540 [Sphaerisporangium krabiense]
MKRAALALAAAASLMVLPACGAAGASPSSTAYPTPASLPPFPPAPGAKNNADVQFLQMLIPHHKQAIQMAEMARTKAVHQDVRDLANAIAVTQTYEVRTMTTWLLDWKKSLTLSGRVKTEHEEHSETRQSDIADLGRMEGAKFESTFLAMLIAHQHNAIAMARDEYAKGKNVEVRNLAHRIDLSRTAQVQEMLKAMNRPSGT